MIVVFVLDTSSSMNQRTSNGLTLLDWAKGAVEHFLKCRGQDSAIRGDRFFLVTCEDSPGAVKVGWNDSFNNFLEEVKNLNARDMSSVGPALKRSFDLLNQYRLQTSIDNYGQGRIPWYIEPAVVVLLTDGCSLSTPTGVINNLTLPLTPAAGADLTVEPFRWDQRLFTILLKPPAASDGAFLNNTPIEGGDSLIGPMSEVTGGKCMAVHTMNALLLAVGSLIPKMLPGVVVDFERLGPALTATAPSVSSAPLESSPPIPTSCSHKMLYVRSNAGNWPIPEAFLPDATMQTLPPRTAHPMIHFRPLDADPFIVKGFPFDEYEIEACPLTAYLLSHNPAVCWQVFVMNSNGAANGPGDPFGYIKASRSTTRRYVSLFVLPYNYPKLWPLLDELVNQHKASAPPPKWRKEFENYLSHIPPYYIPLLKNALKRFGTGAQLVPDQLDAGLSYNVVSYLKKLKQQSKMETDRMRAAFKQVKDQGSSAPLPSSSVSIPTGALPGRPAPRTYGSLENAQKLRHSFHALLDKGSLSRGPKDDGTSVGSEAAEVEGQSHSEDTTTPLVPGGCRNVFDMDRSVLLQHVARLQHHLSTFPPAHPFALPTEASFHAVSISQMGNYHDVLMKRQSLRPIEDEDKKKRGVFFGNPFVRSDKASKMANMIDALEIDVEGDEAASNVPGQAASRGRFKKRRKLNRPGGSPKLSPKEIDVNKPVTSVPVDKTASTPDGKGNADNTQEPDTTPSTAIPQPGTEAEKDDWWTLNPSSFPKPTEPEPEGSRDSMQIEAIVTDTSSSDVSSVAFASPSSSPSPSASLPSAASVDVFAKREATSYQAFALNNEAQLGRITKLIRSRKESGEVELLKQLEDMQGLAENRAACRAYVAEQLRRWKRDGLAQQFKDVSFSKD